MAANINGIGCGGISNGAGYKQGGNIMVTLKKRQRIILLTLKELSGVATTKQIAEKANLNTNGVSQTLGANSLRPYVQCFGGRAGETKWKLKYRALEVIGRFKNN